MDKRSFSKSSTLWQQTHTIASITKYIDDNYQWGLTAAVKKIHSNYDKVSSMNWAPLTEVIPESFCLAPFKKLQIDPDGRCKPCCKYKVGTSNDLNEKLSPNANLIELWNQDEFKKLRESFMKGERPEGCKICWEEESLGLTSLRQILSKSVHTAPKHTIFEILPSQSPAALDLKLSNMCNLKCRICSPWLSTQWIKEDRDLKLSEGFYKIYTANSKDRMFVHSENEQILKDWTPKLATVEFYGGEPLMQQEHERILSIMAESGAENIVLFYNTNGTIYEEKFFDLWKKFKTVRINFSIDDVEDRFEYQRKNAKWDEVLANIEKYMTLGKQTSKFEFSIYCTVSTFNVFYIKEFVEKLAHLNIDFWFNIVHFPNHFSIKELPLNVKTKIKEKINTIDLSNVKIHRDSISINDVVNFMMDTQDLSESFLKGLDKIKLHDEYRKESFKDIFPELFDLYNSSL
jgi:hypothetical protein